MRSERVAQRWQYDGGDGCVDFFAACLAAADPDISPTAHVLEIGCSEFDWLTPASTCWPEMTFTGIDWRAANGPQGDRIIRACADIREPKLFPPESFEWIVSISTIEHIGLGHYDHDPLDPNGDTAAVSNALQWLKPWGWLMFDVPYDPSGYRVEDTSCRVYDAVAIRSRLLLPLARASASEYWVHWVGYAEATRPHLLIDRPTERCDPYHYIGFVIHKLA